MLAGMKTSQSASARWAWIIQQQEAGALSIAEFCRRREVSPPSFFAWRRRLRLGVEPPAAFVELKTVSPEHGGGASSAVVALELVLPGGLRVQVRPGFDRQTLRDLVAALEALP